MRLSPGTARTWSRPVPTERGVWAFALGAVPALFAVVGPGFVLAAAAIDLAVLIACAIDFLLAMRPQALRIEREVEPVLSSGVAHPVTLAITSRARARVVLRDQVPSGPEVEGARQRLTAEPRRNEVVYTLRPLTRGDLTLGPVHVRVEGPLGLCARQGVLDVTSEVRVLPDLSQISKDALRLAAAREEPSTRTVHRIGEGREFESLREYRAGDDVRAFDWKATARRGKAMVRVFEPERAQSVQLFLDCGRHLAGMAQGRRKLDHAMDAALRLAAVCLDRGDRVGVTAFGRRVMAMVPPERGREQLRVLARALYKLEATLDESDLGRALELTFARQHRRTLVVLFTDLLDAESSRALVQRTLLLKARHLPVVVSLADVELREAAIRIPQTPADAYLRQEAARLEASLGLTVAELRNAGAKVVRASPDSFSAAAVNVYLDIKERGLL